MSRVQSPRRKKGGETSKASKQNAGSKAIWKYLVRRDPHLLSCAAGKGTLMYEVQKRHEQLGPKGRGVGNVEKPRGGKRMP